MILVDTSVWVESTRQKDGLESQELDSLIGHDLVATTDMVIAEVLQGTGTTEAYRRYESQLNALHFFHIQRGTWLRAAELSFQLRRRGMPTPLPDLLIATVALENDLEVYAIDSHFERVPGLRRYTPSYDPADRDGPPGRNGDA